MNKKYQNALIPIGICMLLACAALGYFHTTAGLVAGAVCCICLVACWRYLALFNKAQRRAMDDLFQENSAAAGRLIAHVGVPCMVFDEEGRIVWRNKTMMKLYQDADLKRLPAACDPSKRGKSSVMEFASGAYQVVNIPIERGSKGRELMFQYWLDRTETEHYKRLYEEQMPHVALIYVDNYEELAADMQFRRNTVLTEVERLVSDMAASIEGIYRRYENGRFVLVFEAKYLASLEKERFALLEQAHAIDTGTEQQVTLSVAVGAANRISSSDEGARQAMELALGRGGDQAVVKSGSNYTFYGGKRVVEARQSRVKTRLFAKAFRQLMENASEVFVMGHKMPDMDCVGAALGILACARQVGCRGYLVLDQSNPSIQQAVDAMNQNRAYEGVLLTPDAVRSKLRSTSMLVVVDTQRASTTIAPDLVERANKLVLIDHHRRSADYIDNATLNYLEARASSTSEMVTETMQYFDESTRPTAFECSALLAGITVDTKHFAFNVGARTFEAAGYLRKNGADIGMVKTMFQNDPQTYADRVDVVKNAMLLSGGVAISTCPQGVKNASLIAAQAADELISIRGTQAAFVLGYENDYISVSGRSLGSINVQIILERLGGGGHLTMAGAQLRGYTMERAVSELKETITAYIRENGSA